MRGTGEHNAVPDLQDQQENWSIGNIERGREGEGETPGTAVLREGGRRGMRTLGFKKALTPVKDMARRPRVCGLFRSIQVRLLG